MEEACRFLRSARSTFGEILRFSRNLMRLPFVNSKQKREAMLGLLPGEYVTDSRQGTGSEAERTFVRSRVGHGFAFLDESVAKSVPKVSMYLR